MQDLQLSDIIINLNPRPDELAPLTKEQGTELAYLGALAKKKKHAASLIVHCYNSNVCGADVSGLSYYCRGESSDTLMNAMFLLIKLSAYLESHEIYGSDFVDSLKKQWRF
ncbi:MAG: hypothetical protein WCF45_10540 [Photobacterium halotolerans]